MCECVSVSLPLRALQEGEEDGPVEEHHGEAAGHGGEGVAATSHRHHVATCQPREDVCQQLVERGSRGMPHLQQVGDGNKLAAVPETGGGFEGEEIDCRGADGQQPSDYQFTTDLLKMSSHSSLTISPTSEASTAEKSRDAS